MKFLRKAANRCRPTLAVAKNNTKENDDLSSVCSASTQDITSCSSSSYDSAKKCTTRVTFAPESENIVYEPSSPLTEEETDNYWYSRENFVDFTESCKELAKAFQKLDRKSEDPQSFGSMLKRAHEACTEAKQSNKPCILGNDDDEATLQRWIDMGCRRGIETMSVTAIHSSQARRKKDLFAAVLAAQNKARDLSPSRRSNYVRMVSRQHSLASRLFAWRLAQ